MIHLIVPLPQKVVGSREDTCRHLNEMFTVMRVTCAIMHGVLTHMQVTLEKIALLDPVFDTADTVKTFEEVGDPVPGEVTTVVKLRLYVCMHVCMYVCM